ncbi:MAG: sulfite oxidase [Phycisphaerae bacterium]|nr:sulfite oxidase [Tepidisphaeraceae bacterium]
MPRTPSRRAFLGTSVAAAVLALGRTPRALAADPAATDADDVVPFLEPQPFDPARTMLHWDKLNVDADWITPTPSVYHVSHYKPDPKLDEAAHSLSISGLVDKPLTLSVADIKKRPRAEVVATLECGGNGMSPSFRGAVANVKWAGTPLGPVLKEAGVSSDAVEIAFWGADKGKEKIRGGEYEQHFARSLSPAMAMRDDVLLCYEMNGQPLTPGHGFPLRLVVPGWFGVAWVKWLNRIEARERPLRTRFMAKDYVTLRGREVDGKTVWEETLVGPINVKSVVARVTKQKDGSLRVTGAAWAEHPIKSVELKVDDADWQPVTLLDRPEPRTWRFWSYTIKDPKPGEHTLTSRATDVRGKAQPTADDPEIKNKKTYWEANQQWARRIKL